MKIYRKKPVEVQAVQWNGENVGEVLKFCGKARIKDDSIFIDTLWRRRREIILLKVSRANFILASLIFSKRLMKKNSKKDLGETLGLFLSL